MQPKAFWVGVVGALGALAGVRALGISTLSGWTEYSHPEGSMFAALALFTLTWAAARQARGVLRRMILLGGSLATAFAFDPWLAALSLVWIASLHAVMFGGGAARPRLGIAYTIASLVALGIACSRDLWPAFQAAHPHLGMVGYLFALAYPLRLAWMLHQVRLQRATVPLVDMLLYLMFSPGFVIVPYMLAIPRLDHFRSGLDRHDHDVERAGLRMLGWGLALTVLAWSVRHVYDANQEFYGALVRRDLAGVLVHSLPQYPIMNALNACAAGALIVGMFRLLGVPLGPSFDRPLAAQTITEFWRRWNMHFRDLLVDVFYYPVLMRHRRNKTRAVVLASFAVFVVGSTLLHLPKHYFRYGSAYPPNLHILVENLVMWAIVAYALVRELKITTPAPPPSPLRFALRCVGTWCLVLIVVEYAGYGSQQAVFGYRPPVAVQSRS